MPRFTRGATGGRTIRWKQARVTSARWPARIAGGPPIPTWPQPASKGQSTSGGLNTYPYSWHRVWGTDLMPPELTGRSEGNARAHPIMTRPLRARSGGVGKPVLTPQNSQSPDQRIDIRLAVERTRRDAQTLCSTGNSRVVDGLNIMTETLKQRV